MYDHQDNIFKKEQSYKLDDLTMIKSHTYNKNNHIKLKMNSRWMTYDTFDIGHMCQS
jgi:hypothetical protein